jgi:hypothetical protein
MLCKVLILQDDLFAWTTASPARTMASLRAVVVEEVVEVEDVAALATVAEEALADVEAAEADLETEVDEVVHEEDEAAQPTAEVLVISLARRQPSRDAAVTH